jgi:uncharacterized protein
MVLRASILPLNRIGGSDLAIWLDAPLTVHITISKTGSKYLFEGHLCGGLRIRCDRCLEFYHRDLETDFRLYLSLPPFDTDQRELELQEEDLSVDLITGDEIDLKDIVREQIYLSLPIKSLCRDECFGLCPLCGSNLNVEKCECQQESRHPGFSKLETLKLP